LEEATRAVGDTKGGGGGGGGGSPTTKTGRQNKGRAGLVGSKSLQLSSIWGPQKGKIRLSTKGRGLAGQGNEKNDSRPHGLLKTLRGEGQKKSCAGESIRNMKRGQAVESYGKERASCPERYPDETD